VIRRVTTHVPDLTAQYPEMVEELFDKRLDYHSKITQEEHIKQYPNDAWISPEQFEEARKRIVAETLEEFTRTRRAREYVWQKHGTPALAEAAGWMDRQAQLGLFSRFRAAGWSERQAWQQVYKVQWAADYADPSETVTYLYDVIEEPDPKAAEMGLKRREIETQEKAAAATAALAEAHRGHSELGQAVIHKIEQTHGAVVGLGMQIGEVKAAASAAADKAGEAKSAAEATKADVKGVAELVAGLWTEHTMAHKKAVEVAQAQPGLAGERNEREGVGRGKEPSGSEEGQFEYVNLDATEWRKAGPHMVRRRGLAEHYRTTNGASGFRALLELHKERWFYPVKKVKEVLAAQRRRRKLPVAAWYDITDWDQKWRPKSAPNWVHPGKKPEPKSAKESGSG
jgi:hypothetical protein